MSNQKKTKTISHQKILKLMIEWAFGCGEILNTHLIKSYRVPLKPIDKGVGGIATEADLLSEAFVMRKIKQHFPDHLIISEEDSFSRKLKLEGARSDQMLWLIDPLDGTNNFFNRVPFFCVSLAFCVGNQAMVGVVYNPVTCELFYAIRGKGAYLVRLVGNRQVKTKLGSNKTKKLFHEALLSANLTSKRVEKDLLKRFPEVRAMRRFGSAALEMSYVAAGMLDAYWEHRLQPWDMAASGLICEEAGVRLSDIKGKTYNPFSGSVLVAHPALFEELLAILSK